MKYTNKFVVATLLSLMALSGCVEEIVYSGEDASKPAPTNLVYDEDNSDKDNTVALYWDATAALKAGATSFTVQIPSGMNSGDVYDNKSTITLVRGVDENIDMATFSSLEKGQRFYLRVRAVYPRSVFSEWTYLMVGDKPGLFEVGTGFIDDVLPAVSDFEYDSNKSNATTLAFNYDDSDASAKNAEKIRFQLINSVTEAVTKEAEIDLGECAVAFTGLKETDQYMLRARAEYASDIADLSLCSEWVDVKNDTTNVFEVGVGPVVPRPVAPAIKLTESTSSTLTFTWSVSDFTSAKKDLAKQYSAALYKDASCSDLVVSWQFASNDAIWKSARPKFIFSGLKANTNYYLKVTELESNLTSEVFEAKTKDFTIVEIGSNAANAGDIILAEDFSELAWGGDYMNLAAGYSASGRGSATVLEFASGENPVGKGAGWYLVDNTVEMGLFNTLGKAIPSTRLKNWGQIPEDGTTTSLTCARPGHLKLGASSKTDILVTPELSNLSGTATVEVTFEASLYGSDPLTAAVFILPSSTMGTSANIVTPTIINEVEKITLVKGSKWTEYVVTIPNVTPTSRIGIGTTREGVSGQHRMHLNQVSIKLVKYGSQKIEVATPIITKAEPGYDQIQVEWGAVENALSYVLEYKKSSDTDWTVKAVEATSYLIKDLEQLTEYQIRVKAIAIADSQSEYSEVSTVSTLKKPAYPKNIATADEFIAFMASEDASTADASSVVYITADLDFTGKTISAPCAKFNGVLEGQNHKITNLVSKHPLFSELYSAKDLTFEASCSFENAEATFIAPLATKSTGLIQNVHNKANVSYSGGDFTNSVVVSGIVAWANGKVENCSNSGNISAISTGSIKGVAVGGVVGYLSAPMLSCTNSGEVQISASHLAGSRSNIGSLSARAGIGGIVGHGGKEADTEMFSMTSCTNSGKVIFKTTNLEKMTATGQRSSIGGICGGGAGPIKNCTNDGEIQVNHNTSTGNAYSAQEAIVIVGGICGGDYCISGQNSSSYDNCVNNGVLNINHDASKSNSAIGGIVGWAGAENATMTVAVKNSRNTAAINVSGKGKHRVGGISGGICNINNVENTGNITVTESNSPAVGGICGFHSQGLDIIEAKVNCTITVPANANCVGGLIGNNGNAANESGEGCEVNVTITGGNDTNAGLIIGMWNGTSKKIVLGTAEKPIKVSGSLNGVTATAENYTTLLAGSNNASDENHVLNTVFAQ